MKNGTKIFKNGFILAVLATSVVGSITPALASQPAGEAKDLANFLQSYFADRGHAIHDSSKVSHVKAKALNANLEELRPAIVQSIFTTIGANIANVEETVDLTNVVANNDHSYDVKAIVHDSIEWVDAGGVTRYSYVTIPHDFRALNTGNSWVIQQDHFNEGPFGVDSDNPASALSRAMYKTRTMQTTAAAPDQKSMTIAPNAFTGTDYYDRVGAVTYAHNWTQFGAKPSDHVSYESAYNNNLYKNFNNDGGDCANFVSQAMYNGGKAKLVGSSSIPGPFNTSTSWYYLNHGTTDQTQHSWTSSWTYCPDHYNFQLSTIGYGYSGGTTTNVQNGDIGYVKKHPSEVFSHVMMVTGHDSNGVPLITCHNYDAYDVPWTSELEFSDSAVTWLNIHLTATQHN